MWNHQWPLCPLTTSEVLETVLMCPLDPRPTLPPQVAILCNHQRAVPKGHQGQMEKLQEKLGAIQEEIDVSRCAGFVLVGLRLFSW